MKVSRRLALQLFLVSRRRSFMNSSFEITVQILIRIELRRIGWQVEHLDFVVVLGQPGFDDLGMVNPQIIENQKDLSLGVLDQAIRRQLLWPVGDNYSVRLPLSLAACSTDPERGFGWRPPSNRSKYSWMREHWARARLPQRPRPGFPNVPAAGLSERVAVEAASPAIGERARTRLKRSGMRLPSDWHSSPRCSL